MQDLASRAQATTSALPSSSGSPASSTPNQPPLDAVRRRFALAIQDIVQNLIKIGAKLVRIERRLDLMERKHALHVVSHIVCDDMLNRGDQLEAGGVAVRSCRSDASAVHYVY